jgi:hypothetical protein
MKVARLRGTAQIGGDLMHAIGQLLTRLGEMAAHPGAFGILVLYAVFWSFLTATRSIGMPFQR